MGLCPKSTHTKGKSIVPEQKRNSISFHKEERPTIREKGKRKARLKEKKAGRKSQRSPQLPM